MMNKKVLHPIVYFSMIFLVLTGIQAYFLYNTVLLKKNEIKARARELLREKDDDVLFLSKDTWEAKLFTKQYKELKGGKLTEPGLRYIFKEEQDSLAPFLKKFVKEKYKESGIQLAFRKQVNKVTDAGTKKLIISRPLVIFETNPKPVMLYGLSESKWESNYSSVSTQENNFSIEHTAVAQNRSEEVKVSFLIEQVIYFDVLNMNVILFKELWGLFFVAVALLAMVLWLYFLSYKKYKQQLYHIQLLHDTIDNIAHEFKTPLATLKIASKQIKRVYDEGTLLLMDRQIARLENLIKPLDEDQTNLPPATRKDIEILLNDYRQLHPDMEWSIYLEVTEALPVSQTEMQTLLSNLIENSIKYGGTSIAVEVVRNLNTVITVTDNGIGIAKKEQPKIWGKYYRVPLQNVHNTKGLGVGLYLVYSIIKKYNGTFTIESDLGKGCKITLTV